MSGDVPQLVSTDEILPEALRQILTEIRDQLGVIIMSQGAEQAQLDTITAGITAVSAHVTQASQTLAQWIANAQAAPPEQPLDFTGAQNALAGLQSADSTLQGIVPQAPDAPLDTPVPDPGPPPAAGDPTGADVPLPPPDGSDPSQPPPDSGSTPDGGGVDTGAPPPDAPTPT